MRRHLAWLALLAPVTAPLEEALPPPSASPDPGGECRMPEAPYVHHQVLVAPPPGVSLERLAEVVDGAVVEPVGASGYGVLEVGPEGAARLDASGARWSSLGRIVGTGRPPRAAPPAWQLDAIGLEGLRDDPSGVVVALLDSGVAYEDRGRFRAASGLRRTTFVAPADFVELDGHPNDDQQHGTHLASLIASDGPLRGVAPGVSLMPVKVLDAANHGTEWSLIEGLYHAVDHGADVINLSLSFPLGYVPSPALEEALAHAWEAGAVVVAAAGNDGAHELSWPAASRVVVAVGAGRSDPNLRTSAEDYSNLGPALDVLAPGGSLDRDANRDGWPDGLLAETIDPADPATLGYWFYEGTSQAAALVSGAAAHLLASGIAPHDVAASLQSGAGGYDAALAVETGEGAGPMDVAASVDAPARHRDLYAGLLPYLEVGGRPRARVAVVDELGLPVVGVDVVGSVSSVFQTQWWRCVTDEAGRCDLAGPGWVGAPSAWAFRVDAVVSEGVATRPSAALFASDAAAVLLAAIEQTPGAEGALLSVHWPAGRDDVLGADLVDAWSVVDLGSGLLSSPLALLFEVRHLGDLAEPGTLDLDLDGTGLLSSPLGRTSVSTLSIGGSGLLSSPLGLRSSTLLVGLDGSGLLSSPLGFHATDLYALGGSGLLSSPLGLGWSGQVLRLDSGTFTASSADGTPFAGLADGTLTRGSDGLSPGRWMIATGAADVGLRAAPPDDRRGPERAPVRYP